jgi:hypothetical protein
MNKIVTSCLDVEIDKLTHSIENVITGESFPTEVIPLAKTDLPQVTKKNGWKFNWTLEFGLSGREVFKLIIIDNSEVIQGLISFSVEIGFIEMHLIETAPHNFGKNKMYYGVPSNLTAFACKRSFEHGFDGYVAFTAKTALIEHYKKILGAVMIGGQRMMLETPQARNLVNMYFNNN